MVKKKLKKKKEWQEDFKSKERVVEFQRVAEKYQVFLKLLNTNF